MNDIEFNRAEFNGTSFWLKAISYLLKFFLDERRQTRRGFAYALNFIYTSSITRVLVYSVEYSLKFIYHHYNLIVKSINYNLNFIYKFIVSVFKRFTYNLKFNISHIVGVFFNYQLKFTYSFIKTYIKQFFYTLNFSFNHVFKTIKNFDYLLKFYFHLAQLRELIIHYTLKFYYGANLPVSWFRLAWLRQINPDIEGFKIYMSNSPYGNWELVKTTTSLVYLFGIMINKRKWIKVVPYTNRGELKPLIMKSVRG